MMVTNQDHAPSEHRPAGPASCGGCRYHAKFLRGSGLNDGMERVFAGEDVTPMWPLDSRLREASTLSETG